MTVFLFFNLISEIDENCPFSMPNVKSRIIEEHGTAIAIKDKHPVSKDHLLIILIGHTPDFFSMTSQGRRDASG